MFYILKPHVIDAIQWTGDNQKELRDWLEQFGTVTIKPLLGLNSGESLAIRVVNEEGVHSFVVEVATDWIITKDRYNFIMIHDEIFQDAYKELSR